MKLTRKQLKIGFWASIGLIIVTLFVIGYQHHIPVQFTSETARSNGQGALVIAVPVLVFTTMGIHYRLYHIKGLPVLHVIFGTILAIGLFIFSGLMSFLVRNGPMSSYFMKAGSRTRRSYYRKTAGTIKNGQSGPHPWSQVSDTLLRLIQRVFLIING